MRICLVVFCLAIAACGQKPAPILVTEQTPLPPIGSNITDKNPQAVQPLPKPRANVDSRDYTAPYPKLSAPAPASAVASPAPLAPSLTQIRDGKKTVMVEQRLLNISVTRGATTTAEFLGNQKKSVFDAPETVTEIPVEDPNSVFNRALNLPPKEIEDGKYRTFRRVEDDIAHDTRKVRGVVAQFLFPEMNEVEEKPQGVPQKPSYCYKSLAGATCYSQPVAGQEFRRVGKID